MSPVQKTGLYYPNKFGLIIIKSLEEVMGRNGLNAILNLAGLNNYIENYPPDNLDKGLILPSFLLLVSPWRKCTDRAGAAVWLCAPDAQPSRMH